MTLNSANLKKAADCLSWWRLVEKTIIWFNQGVGYCSISNKTPLFDEGIQDPSEQAEKLIDIISTIIVKNDKDFLTPIVIVER